MVFELVSSTNCMHLAINGHSTPNSAVAMAIVAISVAPPLSDDYSIDTRIYILCHLPVWFLDGEAIVRGGY